jgi:hypothetical protein
MTAIYRVTFLAVVATLAVLYSASSVKAANGGAGTCNASLWQFVYHAYRLTGTRPCITVTGVVDTFKAEPDGDFHLGLRLQASNSNLLNSQNVGVQHGDLVVEAVCQGNVTQQDVIDLRTCNGYTGPHFQLSSRNKGQTVTVTGTFVSDGIHGWNEIHPVSSVQLGASGGMETSSGATSSTASESSNDDASAAKIDCGNDTIVWVNTRTKLYHRQGSRWFGHTSQGIYMCKHDADNAGYQDAGE